MDARRQKFVANVCAGMSQADAARDAGFSAKTARQIASKLMKDPEIRAAVDAATKKHVEKAGVTADMVLGELLRIGTADIAQAFDAKGRLLPLHEMPEDIRRAISGVDVEQLYEGRGEERVAVGTLVKVRFWDKPGSLGLLGKHLKLFTDKVEHSGGLVTVVLKKLPPPSDNA